MAIENLLDAHNLAMLYDVIAVFRRGLLRIRRPRDATMCPDEEYVFYGFPENQQPRPRGAHAVIE
jgi:hypothetical protein